MADPTPPETRELSERPYPGTPTWVKVFAIVIATVVVAVLLVTVAGTALGLHTPMPGGHTR